MAMYQYRCRTCGLWDSALPMGSAPAAQPCPRCGAEAPRAYTAPNLACTSTPLAEALTRAEKSRDKPEVVTELPPRRRSSRPGPPPHLLKKLPKW